MTETGGIAIPGHMVLVTKVEQNGLICCDPYFEKEDQRLPLTLFYKGLQEVFFTNYHEPETITRQERQDAVVNMYGALAGNGPDGVCHWKSIETTVDFYTGRDWRKRQIFHRWEHVM